MYDYHSERNGSLDVRRTQVGMSNTSNQYVEPGKGLMFTVTGGTVTRKMSGEEVGLPYSLYEVVSEVGTGPRPHIHHGQDEAYYVLAGNEMTAVYEDCLRSTEHAAVKTDLLRRSKKA